MPFIDFSAGEVLTAANVDIIMRQTVMVFDDANQRDTALSAVLAEGMVAYTKDDDIIRKYSGSAWSPIGEDSILSEGEKGQNLISNGTAGVVYENSISPLLLLGV